MFVAIVGLVLAAAPAPKQLQRMGAEGVASIRPAALSAHVKFLSHDLLEGRGTGTRGEAIAAEYVATQFAGMGLEPAGENGTWFQRVPLRETAREDSASVLEVRRGEVKQRLTQETEFLLGFDAEVTAPDVTAPVVFAGYGVHAPEQKHDDFAQVDVKGKIALVLYGAPARFPSTSRAVYSRSSEKYAELQKRGAAGVIVVWTPALEKMYGWVKAVADAKHPTTEWVEGKAGSTIAGLPARARISPAGTEKFLQLVGFGGGVETLVSAADQGKPQTIALDATVRIAGRGTPRTYTAPNVVARLPGSDKTLAAEYVVFGSHLDHIGIGEPVNGDAIYNGALDNASGIASMIEIARAFTQLSRRPKRSILFVAFTGEEFGTLGSDYFAYKPTVPRSSMVANVNVDMIVAAKPVHDIVALGAEHSSLGEDVAAACKAAGVALSADKHPEQVLFIRSDQISFVTRGIPALFVVPGELDAKGDAAGERAKITEAFFKERYHAPQDEWSMPISWEGQAKVTEVAFLTGLSAANRKERPAWKKGDFFSRFAAPQ